MPRVTRHTGIPRVVHRRAAHTLSDMIGIQDFPRSLSLHGRHRPPSYVLKLSQESQQLLFFFLVFFFLLVTPAPVRVVSQAVLLAYLVIFFCLFFTFAQPFRGACSGRWEECPVAAAEITCVINGVIDHRSSRGRRSESRPFHKTHKRRHAAHRPSSTSTIAAGWQLLAPSFLFVLRIRSRSDV